MDFSGLIFLLFVGFLANSNAGRAKRKGKSAGLYAFLTVISFFFFFFIIGGSILVFLCRNDVNFSLLNDPANSAKNYPIFQQQLYQALNNNQLRPFTVILIGYGGYLLIRYIIEKAPDKKKDVAYIPDNENAV